MEERSEALFIWLLYILGGDSWGDNIRGGGKAEDDSGIGGGGEAGDNGDIGGGGEAGDDWHWWWWGWGW